MSRGLGDVYKRQHLTQQIHTTHQMRVIHTIRHQVKIHQKIHQRIHQKTVQTAITVQIAQIVTTVQKIKF